MVIKIIFLFQLLSLIIISFHIIELYLSIESRNTILIGFLIINWIVACKLDYKSIISQLINTWLWSTWLIISL